MARPNTGLSVRSGRSEGGWKVKAAIVSLLMVMVLFSRVTSSQSKADMPSSRHIEVRIETLANREGELAEPCEVLQVKTVSSSLSFASWSTLGEARSSETEPSGNSRISALHRISSHCGGGPFPGISQAPSSGSPGPAFHIHAVSVSLGWDAGAMDPGPFGAFTVAIMVTSRQQTGFSPEAKPLYTPSVVHRRSTRLEPGEVYVVPVQLGLHGRETLAVHEVLLRIRVGWVDREGATEYGSISVIGAAPGSEIVLDGGTAR